MVGDLSCRQFQARNKPAALEHSSVGVPSGAPGETWMRPLNNQEQEATMLIKFVKSMKTIGDLPGGAGDSQRPGRENEGGHGFREIAAASFPTLLWVIGLGYCH